MPDLYQWSSYREITGQVGERFVKRERFQQYSNIGSQEYDEFIRDGVNEHEQQFISKRIDGNLLTGSSRFVEEIEDRTGIRGEHKKPGRPPKKPIKKILILSRISMLFIQICNKHGDVSIL